MIKHTFFRWIVIVCYLAILFWVWKDHLPVRNIALYFLTYIILTVLMLILFRVFSENDKGEGV